MYMSFTPVWDIIFLLANQIKWALLRRFLHFSGPGTKHIVAVPLPNPVAVCVVLIFPLPDSLFYLAIKNCLAPPIVA
jgi:hypothetical protein